MRYALFGAGAVTKSFLGGLPRLSRELGAVAAPSYRLASRIVNTMRAGHAVKSADEFADERTLLMCVPESILARSVAELSNASLDWSGRAVLLCESLQDSTALDPVRRRGAATGSIHPIEASDGRFIIEGDREAVRIAKHLVNELNGRAIEFNRGEMALYGAGLAFGSTLFTPLIAASMECLAVGCGDSPAALRIVEALFQSSLRAYVHAGKKSWSGAVASGEERTVLRDLRALRQVNPSLARYYRDSAVFALEFFNRHPEMLRRLSALKLEDYPDGNAER